MNFLNDELPIDLTLTPRSLSAYLAVSGWHVQDQNEIAEVWTPSVDIAQGFEQILLPTALDLRDYPTRFNETLRALCNIHDWDIFQLANAVVSIRSDVMHLRANQSVRLDSIPLKQAHELIEGTVKLLTAAAKSTLAPKASHNKGQTKAVTDFINDDVRMGHTQRGSFVITVLTQLDEVDVIPNADAEIPTLTDPQAVTDVEKSDTIVSDKTASDVVIAPFQRRVMSTVARAMNEVSLLSENKSNGNYETAIESGVSAEFCDSLAKMTNFEGLKSLDMSIKWAPAEPQGQPDVSDIVLNRDQIPNLRSIVENLKSRDTPTTQSLYGKVVKLELDDTDPHPDAAIATVRGVIGRNQRRQAKIKVSGESHQVAIRSYRDRISVNVVGDIQLKGNSYWMAEGATILPVTI